MSEAGILALIGAGIGTAVLYGALLVGQPIAAREFGLFIPIALPSARDLIIPGMVVVAGVVVGAVPALKAYRLSLADGLSLRVRERLF